MSGDCNLHAPFPRLYLKFLVYLPSDIDIALKSAQSEVIPIPASTDWWVSLAIAHNQAGSLWRIFRGVHILVRMANLY
jgi:hypothetical protein